jgi:hypothetical protein
MHPVRRRPPKPNHGTRACEGPTCDLASACSWTMRRCGPDPARRGASGACRDRLRHPLLCRTGGAATSAGRTMLSSSPPPI